LIDILILLTIAIILQVYPLEERIN